MRGTKSGKPGSFAQAARIEIGYSDSSVVWHRLAWMAALFPKEQGNLAIRGPKQDGREVQQSTHN